MNVDEGIWLTTAIVTGVVLLIFAVNAFRK